MSSTWIAVLVASVAVVFAAGAFGGPVVGLLDVGDDFCDPQSESIQARDRPSDATGAAAFARQLDHFVASVAGEPASRVTNDDGFASQLAIDAAYRSVASRTQTDSADVMAVPFQDALATR